jgi:hypothetical protein
MVFRRWATRKLHTGDLTALLALANGGQRPSDTCLDRLSRRGFVLLDANGPGHRDPARPPRPHDPPLNVLNAHIQVHAPKCSVPRSVSRQ